MPRAIQREGRAPGILTTREQQVVALVCAGHHNKTIARLLCIKEGSVKRHLSRVYRKFGGQNRDGLIRTYAKSVAAPDR